MLPAALDLGVRLEAVPAEMIRLTSRDRRGIALCAPDGEHQGKPPRGWGRYVAAVATELDLLGRPRVGLEGEITSTLPIGTGLSSSAALEVAVALALCAVADFALEPLDLARAAQRAEHRAVGVPSGIMDQAVAMLGRDGHLLLLDTGSLDYEHVVFPPQLALLVVYTGVSRQLERSGYGERRAELAEALRAGDIHALPPKPARRLRHVVSENERVSEAVRLLREPSEANLDRLGEVFREGHESLRHDFEATTPELDLLVELAYEAGARAARMTGGGFGGSIVALADSSEAGTIAAELVAEYNARSGRPGRAFVCAPSDGARELV